MCAGQQRKFLSQYWLTESGIGQSGGRHRPGESGILLQACSHKKIKTRSESGTKYKSFFARTMAFKMFAIPTLTKMANKVQNQTWDPNFE